MTVVDWQFYLCDFIVSFYFSILPFCWFCYDSNLHVTTLPDLLFFCYRLPSFVPIFSRAPSAINLCQYVSSFILFCTHWKTAEPILTKPSTKMAAGFGFQKSFHAWAGNKNVTFSADPRWSRRQKGFTYREKETCLLA